MSGQTDMKSEAAQYRGVWTCNNPNLPEREEHTSGTETVDSLDTFAQRFTIHDHTSCLECEDYNSYYEASLDRVEVLNEDGEVIDTLPPETMVEDHGMDDAMGEVN